VPSVITLMNLAVARRDVPLTYNPFKGLSKKTRGRKDKVPLSAAEVLQLGRSARAKLRDYGPMMKALVLFAAYSGMRPGEIFALEWGDVDFEAMRIRVRRRVYGGKTALPKSNRDAHDRPDAGGARRPADGAARRTALIFTDEDRPAPLAVAADRLTGSRSRPTSASAPTRTARRTGSTSTSCATAAPTGCTSSSACPTGSSRSSSATPTAAS
jgi:integrase